MGVKAVDDTFKVSPNFPTSIYKQNLFLFGDHTTVHGKVTELGRRLISERFHLTSHLGRFSIECRK